jgi:hypothetical protein
MIPPDTHTKLLIQKGGKVDIFRPKLTFTDTGFNTYNLVLNIQLPEAPEMGIVCVNKLIRVTLSGNRKSVLQYNDIKPTCEINTFPNLETGLNIYSFSDSRVYELQYNSPAGSVNTFSATGIHRESTFDTDLWEFNFFVNDPADDFITKEEMKTMESRSMLNKNPLISTFIDESKEHEKTLPDKGNMSTVVGLIPSGYIQIIIKNLKINPERLEIKPGMFVLNITLGNDTNATSAQTHNEAINLCLSYVEKYNEMIRNTPINTTLSIKNPVSSQTDILTKFGKLIGKNKSLYQQLYMYFFIGINFDAIRAYYLHTITDVGLLCRTDSINKNEVDKDYINYSNFFDDSRIDKFIFLFTKIMNMLIDQDVRSITLKTISDLFELEIKLNADEYESLIELPSVPSSRALTLEKAYDTYDEENALRRGPDYGIDNSEGGSYNNSQEGGVDDFDHLACAKMVPMQITKLGTNPNNMIVTVTQMHIDSITIKDPPIPAPVKVDISVGDAIRFVENGEVVYGIICGFKSGKKKYLNGKIESNINIEDYWESAKSFTGDSGIAKLNELDIDQVVSIVNLRGIIYVRYEYNDDIGYGYCPEKAKDSTGKIIFDCNTDKELSMLPNGYNPSAASVAQKATSAIINTFKLGKSTPFGVGSYSEIQYSLKSYMTLAKVTPPKNFTDFVKELKTIRQPGVNSNYIQQLGGLINKHSLNDDCGRYGMKVADIAISQTAANFLNKVNATTSNYSGAMRGVFDMTKSNNFIVRNLLQINLTQQELKDTIYGVNADQSKLGVTIPKLIYGLMLRYPDYVTSMKLIFSALSDEKDDDIQGIISKFNSTYQDEQGGGAKGNVIKQLIDALIDIIKKQKLLRMDIIGNLSSACDSAFSQYNIHDDSASFKTELNQSLTPSTRRISRDADSRDADSRSADSRSADSRNVETENASAPESRRSAALGYSIFQNLADKFVSKSGEVGNISSMGSTSCADAKVMCNNNGIIQVQIDLQELLSNCLSSNAETGGTIDTPYNVNPINGSRLQSYADNKNIRDTTHTKPPVNTTPPKITGDNKVGSILQVSNGFWDGSEEQEYTYEYQWYRDDAEIPDAKTNKYTIAEADIGKKITCKVTAINKGVRSDAMESDNAITDIAAGEIEPDIKTENKELIEEDKSTIDSVRAAYTKYYSLYGKVAAGGGGGGEYAEGEDFGGGGGYNFIQEGGTRFQNNNIFQGQTSYPIIMNDRTFNFNNTQITTQMMNQENLTRLKDVVDKMTTDGKDVDMESPEKSGKMFEQSNKISGTYENNPENFPKTVIFTKNDIAGSGKSIADYLLKGNNELKELRLESCDLNEKDITDIMNVFLEEPPIALESLIIGGNPGLTVKVLLSMLDMFADPKFSKNLKTLNIIVAGSVGIGNRVSSTTIGALDAENNVVDEILKKSYGDSKQGNPIASFGDEFQSCLPSRNQQNSNYIASAKKRLTVTDTEPTDSESLKPEVTGRNYLQELTQAKATYDADVTGAMPIATHIQIMEDVVANFAPITPTSETEPAPTATATVSLHPAQDFVHKAAIAYLSELKSKKEGALTVAFNAETLTSATLTFTKALGDIEQNYNSSAEAASGTLKVSDTETISEQKLNIKKDAIIGGYNKMLDFISDVIGNQEPCKTSTSSNLQTYIDTFRNSIQTTLSSTMTFNSIQPYKDNVTKIANKFIDKITNNNIDNKFQDVTEFCKILTQQVELYRSLTKQLETKPSEDSKKLKYNQMISGGIDAFITKILQANVQLNGDNFKFISSGLEKRGGSNSSRKHNSRKKRHRKSSSKARNSRRNTLSSSTSKNHKKVRFVKTS